LSKVQMVFILIYVLSSLTNAANAFDLNIASNGVVNISNSRQKLIVVNLVILMHKNDQHYSGKFSSINLRI